jgi:hypothetical protein
MLYLIKHSVFICLCLWVPKHIYAMSILPFFVSPPRIPLHSPMKNKKRLASVHTICGHRDLESSLAFVLATLRLFELYSLCSFLIIRP